MRLGIVFYNRGRKGGAERRYYNLICELAESQKVYLLANASVLDFWQNFGDFPTEVEIGYFMNDGIGKKSPLIQTGNGESDPIKKNIFKRLFPKRLRSFLSSLLIVFRLNLLVLKWAKKHKITHINAVQASGILVVLAKIFRRKIVFSYVDYMIENGYPFRWITNQGLKTVVRISDRFDFLSEMIPRKMQKKGLKLKSGKIYTPPNSFTDYSRFNITLPKKRKIVFSGRLETIKNPFLALDVAKELKKRNISYRLLILGNGKLRNDLQKYVNENQLDDQVKIFSTSRVEDELRDSLVFLSLQKENNYPSQALLEAMASGCIPIVTDVGETRKIVDEKVGYLVQENVIQIADIIEYIFRHINEFEDRGKDIRSMVTQKFCVESYLKYYLALFQF